MKDSFQDGVDAIYNAIVAQGTTPGGKSPAACKDGINSVATNKYNSGKAEGYNEGYNAGHTEVTSTSAVDKLIESVIVDPGSTELVNSNSGGTYTFTKSIRCLVVFIGYNSTLNGRAQILSCNAPHKVFCSRLKCSSHTEVALILVNASQGSSIQYITWGDFVTCAIFELE